MPRPAPSRGATATSYGLNPLTRILPLLISLSARLVKATPLYALSAVSSTFETLKDHHHSDDHADNPQMTKEEYWTKLFISGCLVLSGGVFAGLTLGLMGLDPLHLRVLQSSSDNPLERKQAAQVLKLLERGRHWVLVVLLLGNTLINESLPVFLDDVLGGGLNAVIASTSLIVIFGEIIPQSICVRYGLGIGAFAAPFVLTMMYLFAPIAWPIAKFLDWVLGANEEHTYKKAELKSFLQFHKTGEEPLRDDEITILNGVLSLNNTKAGDIMTPIKDVLTLSADTKMDHEQIDEILLSGFSRIPIHEPGKPKSFIGMLLIKKLLLYNPEESLPVSAFALSTLPEAKPTINCFQALDYFQTGRAHLLMISDTPGKDGGALGVVSLEDLIEEIIGEEIVDETDRYVDNRHKKTARRTSSAEVMKGIIEREKRKLVRQNTYQGSPAPSRSETPMRIEEETVEHEELSNSETAALLDKTGQGKNGNYGSVLSTSPKNL